MKKDRQLQLISKDICEAVKEKLQDNLNKFWYSNYSPQSYQRTWELFDSITGIIRRDSRCNYTICIYFDSDKIHAVENDNGWNFHMGFNSEAFTESLVSSIEHGMKGSFFNPRRGEAAHMIEFTQKWANEYACQLLRQRLY